MKVPQLIKKTSADDVGAANTTVINGIEYETIELTADDVANKAQIAACNQNQQGNYRYVLTADWNTSGAMVMLYGNAVIFDLNSFTYHVDDSKGNIYTGLSGVRTELTDTSAAQTGRVITENGSPLIICEPCQTFVLAGGDYSGFNIDLHTNCHLMVYGGNLNNFFWGGSVNVPLSIQVAPWVQSTYGNFFGEIKTPTYFAISTSSLVTGKYNTVYGYQWEINAATLANLTLPTDKTYYLWGRDADGQYEFLDLRCTDGQNWEKYTR